MKYSFNEIKINLIAISQHQKHYINSSFIYNKRRFEDSSKADSDFMLVTAHEFGHLVLMYAGGLLLSWGHK